MFKCDECNHEFAKPERFKHKEYADYGIGGEWLTAYISDVCPDCGSEDYEETVDEDDDATEQDEVLGMGLQHEPATADDRQGMA